MNKLFIVILLFFVIGCSTFPWIDADNCKVQANVVLAGIETEWPGAKTRLVYGKLRKTPHVEAQAFINNKWKYARLITLETNWQIVFYDNIQGFSRN